jgi:hypothetical protein
LVRPVGHTSEQTPALHASPAAHSVPHAPQFVRSVSEFTQRSVQRDQPIGQATLHVPALQDSPAAHACMHAPQ